MWWFALGIVCCYSPLAWVKNIKKFAFAYIIGNAMIVFTAIVVCGYATKGLIKNGPLNQDSFQAVNTKNMWDMVGFSFYCFEGIGVVLPIME